MHTYPTTWRPKMLQQLQTRGRGKQQRRQLAAASSMLLKAVFLVLARNLPHYTEAWEEAGDDQYIGMGGGWRSYLDT